MKLPIGRIVVGAAIFSAQFAFSPSAEADYAVDGPEATTTTDLPASTDGGAIGGSLVVPNGAGPYPLLVTTHGFSGSSTNQLGWAQHFATYGFVVVVPSLPSTFDPDENVDAAIIEDLAAYYSNPPTGTPAFGKVDGTKIGLEGHSAGGLATTMASSVINPQATVLFDPVDANGVGVGDVPKICSPLMEIYADPSSCNNEEGWDSAKAVSLGDQIQFHVVGANHCSGENAVQTVFCDACGGTPTVASQDDFSRYATAFFLAYLKGDAAAAATITSSALAADTSISGPDVKAGKNCDGSTGPTLSSSDGGVVTTSDGGTGTGSNPGRDGGTIGGDAGNGASTSPSGSQDAETPGSDSSSGCSCNDVGRTDDRRNAYFLSAVAIGLVLARRKVRKTNR
jgi:dienelactone hydrolase